MALTAGSSFGPYTILEQIGRGGMASVYKAYEPPLDRYIALKVLPGEFLEQPGFAARFEREAKVIAKLEHPNIVPIFNYGLESSARIPWMAMRLIPGGSLSALLRRTRLGHERIVAIVRAVADALQYAHTNGVVHRDVKPQNILLDTAGRVYLADFGIARIVEGASALTQTGLVTGTPQYMAPEQAEAQPIDGRCDIYALGIVAYEMLVGTVPFTADTPVAVLMKQVSAPVPLPSPAVVPEPMMRAVLKSLAKRPEDRWRTATDFARALEQALVACTTTTSPEATRQLSASVGLASASTSLEPVAGAVTRPVSPARHRLARIAIATAIAGVIVLSTLAAAWALLRARPATATGGPDRAAAALTSPANPTGAPALAIDLEVSQAVGAVVDVLFVRLDLDDHTVRELALTFPPETQPVRRESVVIEDVATGSHHLRVLVSSQRGTPSSDAVEGTKTVRVAGGVNRLPVRVSFVGPDSVVDFQ